MRTTAGILHFFVNGRDLGVAASAVPPAVYAVVDVYGRCMQVTASPLRLIDTNRGHCKSHSSPRVYRLLIQEYFLAPEGHSEPAGHPVRHLLVSLFYGA